MATAPLEDSDALVSLGVIVPCRNEEAVIERKLENLVAAQWPVGRHVLTVIDDGSSDATWSRVETWIREREGRLDLRVELLSNREGQGKPGAIRTGLDAVRGADLVVLSDADVLVAPDALVLLSQAFVDDANLAMACGGQLFVESLSESGSFEARDGSAFSLVSGLYDRWTAWVRRLESRSGRLFSVHGQLLAWRAELGLLPDSELAADDLDLRMQVRARTVEPRAIRLVPNALFAEVKEVDHRDAQALRRARAYVQTIVNRPPPQSLAGLDRVQLAAYRWLPMLAPWGLVGVALSVPVAMAWWRGPLWGVGAAGALGVLAFLGPMRRLVRLCGWILRASRAERRSSMGASWDMRRTREVAADPKLPEDHGLQEKELR